MISTYEKVLWTATRLLRVLSAWIPVKYEIVAQDPLLDFFNHCLECHSSRVITNALWTMRNLSDIAVDNITSDVSVNVVKQLLSQLRLNICSDSYGAHYSTNTGGDTPVSRCVLGALANLTCRNNAAKSYVVRHNGIDLILQVLYTEISGQKNYYHTFCDNLNQSMSNMSIQCNHDEDDHSNTIKKSFNKLHNNNDHYVTEYPTIATATTTTTSTTPTTTTTESSINSNQINHSSSSSPSPPSSSPSLLLLSFNNSITIKNYLIKQKNLLNLSIFNSTLDLIEAGLRCLSHLTIGHMELINVYHYFIHQRIAFKLIISIGNIYLPSLLSFPFDQYINLCKDTTNNTTYNTTSTSSSSSTTTTTTTGTTNWEFDCLTQILQLTKTWTILVRNLCINYYSTEFKSNAKLMNNNNNNNNNNNSHLWPKHLRSQLRHGIHKLVQHLRHLINSIPRDLQPKELKPTMEFVHHVSMTLFSLNNNNNNNNNHNNSTNTEYESQ
uniref:Rap-GAP domain-containing protein n=1 Tax=Schistosoma mansoni TaxID=6183 RepID=A0A5K4FCM0_SCHMA